MTIALHRFMLRSAWLLLSAGFAAWADGAETSAPERYTNPIGGTITMGDPFVLADAGQLYLYGTTAVNDGFKCWSSTNWIDWSERGFAYRKTATSWGGKTFWAPEVVRYGGRYYMVFSCEPATNKTFSTRICLAVSDRPEGPFTDARAPWLDLGKSCIDAHLFIDGDGSPYLYFDQVGVLKQPPKQRPDLGVTGPGHNCVLRSPDGKDLWMVYHAHEDSAKPGGKRTVNLDRLIIEPDGSLRLIGPTRTPQPRPQGFETHR